MDYQLNNGNAYSSDCGCRIQQTKGLTRRDFMKIVTAGAATLSSTGLRQVFAGPFDNDYLKFIPTDKKLDPSWIRSLYEHGQNQKSLKL